MHKPQHISMRWVEIAVALLFALVGAVVVMDSLRTGNEWASDGPQPGYFPFYIGALMIACAGWVVLDTLKKWRKSDVDDIFATHAEFKLVLKMLLPTCIFVAAVFALGLYVSAIFFIAFFMRWQGHYAWWKALVTGTSVAAVLFALFEVWFLVQLPKGPLETWLGY